MLATVWAVVKEGKIELLEQMSLPEGARLLVTVVPAEEEADLQQSLEAENADAWRDYNDCELDHGRAVRELVAVRERETRLREALEQIADESECSIGLKAVEAHGDTFCAYHVARAALVASLPLPGEEA